MLPGRGRSCSGYAIGYIPEKWPTWEAFSKASFEEVYGDPSKIAERYDADELKNVLLSNDGSGKFSATELPGSAQWSAVFGIGVGDFNNDGNLDALLAQNFYAPQPETSRWVSGYGSLLLGDGKGGFTDLEPLDSGVRIETDGRGVVVADFNEDGLLDAVVSQSNLPEGVLNEQTRIVTSFDGHGRGSPRVLMGRPEHERSGRGLLVEVAGKGGNSRAIGAKLTLELSDGTRLSRAVQAGSGYLSSYSGPLHFGIPAGKEALRLTVVWPDGTTGELTELTESKVRIAWP
jgi:hypothetical protein